LYFVPTLLDYVLGAAEVLLATLFEMVLNILLKSFGETKWMARLMSQKGNGEEGKKVEGRNKELEILADKKELGAIRYGERPNKYDSRLASGLIFILYMLAYIYSEFYTSFAYTTVPAF
jgi:hypothetical protein